MSETVMVGSAWRTAHGYAPTGWHIGRCTACGRRYAWERKHAVAGCIDCGAPLQMTRRYAMPRRLEGWIWLQRSDVGFSHWKARGWRALQERSR